ncbi:MAG: pyridoxal phosphate-dependent aminotransferase [Planctomycetota bacterium]|nr:MAG: pyridoxal phosphate-dependent aminotransferase [Planctomycetota bacterium]
MALPNSNKFPGIPLPVPPVHYFAWLRRLPPAAQRRHDLLLSGMGPEDAAVLAERAGALGPEAFADLAWQARDRIEQPLAELLRLPRAQVRCASAATGALYLAFRALLAPGMRVALEEPAYEPLWVVPESLGAQVVFYRRSLADGRVLDPLPDADLYVASHTHNPTGFPLAPADLEALCAAARRRKCKLLLAAAYLLFLEEDGLPRPLPPELVLTGSLTKTLGLSPLRLGFVACGDPGFAEALQQAYELVEIYPPTAASEIALRVAFDGSLLRRARAHAAALQPLWRRCAAALPRGFAFDPPPAGVHALIRLPAGTDDAAACAAAQRHGVYVVPGSLFRAPGSIRIGCGRPLAEVAAALDVLTAVLRQL